MYINSIQLPEHSVVPSLVLVLALSSWMRSSAAQVLASYWHVPVVQLHPMTVFILLMLVSVVKVYLRDRMIVLHFTYKSFSSNCYILSSMCNWSATTCGRKHSVWRQSWDLHQQWMGHCVWWFLEPNWCHCSVPTARLLKPRSATSGFMMYVLLVHILCQ